MTAYLKIENPGVCPAEGFTVFGVSLANTSNNAGVIGQFGSGNKHSVAVLLRHHIKPIIYSGNQSLEFGSKLITVNDGLNEKEFERVFVKYGGKDSAGKNCSSTEDLGFVLDYGIQEWGEVSLALREFVSNAIDRCIRESGNWDGVKVEIVDEKNVRAKSGSTRIFIPLTNDVLEFYNNLGKWFLHFSEPESISKTILPKKDRNLNPTDGVAVIYRRGVRVREFTNSKEPSIFDYNINNLAIDESRKASDWDVRYEAGRALTNAGKNECVEFLTYLMQGGTDFWEFGFDSYSLNYSGEIWTEAFNTILGPNVYLTSKSNDQSERLIAKGYVPLVVRDEVYKAIRITDRKDFNVLSLDDLEGRTISEPTENMILAVDYVWNHLVKHGMTGGKEKPAIKGFHSLMEGDKKLLGYYRDGVVYFHKDYCDGGITTDFTVTVLEEIGHYVTGATDNSRAFQEFFIQLNVKQFSYAGVI